MPMSDEWPPKHLAEVHRDVEIWAAWWSGRPDELSRVYGGGHNSTEQSFSQRGLRGSLNALGRWFWGQPARVGEQRSKLHVPVAAEIARVSADLLFGQPPSIVVADLDSEDAAAVATQERIDVLLGERTHAQLYEAAEACSALGHVYLKGGWDLDIDPTAPLPSTVDADAAYPTYQHGRLRDVLFVREWSDAGEVLRHFELHERGIIWHAAYLGTPTSLGRPVPLQAHPETEDLVQDGMVADDSRPGAGIETGIDRLDVVGIPNARATNWRHIPGARYLGQADIAGVEPALDALDDNWTSLMRDVRHGRSRIHVPAHMLETRGKGQGATVDLDREVYTGLNSPPDGLLQLTTTQFAIRDAQHLNIANALLERIAGGSGYDQQTLGMAGDVAITATESWAKQVRSQGTRRAKIRNVRPELIEFTRIMLDLDRARFRGRGNPDLSIDVLFPDTVSESMLARAQTIAQLRAAEVISIPTAVEMQHGDWDDEAIQAEVDRILDERRSAAPDPMALFDNLEPSGGTRPDPNAGDQQPNEDEVPA